MNDLTDYSNRYLMAELDRLYNLKIDAGNSMDEIRTELRRRKDDELARLEAKLRENT